MASRTRGVVSGRKSGCGTPNFSNTKAMRSLSAPARAGRTFFSPSFSFSAA